MSTATAITDASRTVSTTHPKLAAATLPSARKTPPMIQLSDAATFLAVCFLVFAATVAASELCT